MVLKVLVSFQTLEMNHAPRNNGCGNGASFTIGFYWFDNIRYVFIKVFILGFTCLLVVYFMTVKYIWDVNIEKKLILQSM